MIKLVFVTAAVCAMFSSSVWADFDYPGEGNVRYPTGLEKPFMFGFGWNEADGKFKIGSKSYAMQLPESYSIAITLSKDEEQIWVQEFNNGFIESFNWQIGDHSLQLKKSKFKNPVKGNYVISLDNKDYFFARNNISITVKFNNEGIDRIAIDGVTKDMGTKQ
ncbi:hypothetical protein [Pseudoalteromonas sp. H105]|jgi:hypothetical protein|uniref:hypothetical protein n=1 Tax=Pseudoalteromonas sp. H105 TaxID=1348393 RepID=UPI000732346E|nr:hypothetical protein [Pseudoalteromonas sp. H105]KTF16294.1 hypothetical protein ATS75_07840 [Pseudoalteromonas sp. H105]